MQKTFTKIVLVGAIVASSLGMTACSDEDLGFGAGVIIGVIIGSDDNDHHHHRPPPRHRPPRHRHYSVDLVGVTEANLVPTELEIASEHLNLPLEQTAVVMQALEQAKDKDFTLIQELGLSKKDLRQMARGGNPSATALQNLARNLQIELGEAHDLIQTLKADLEYGLYK